MRIYVPPGAGLGSHEITTMRRLSRGSLAIIADELTNPASWSTVRRVLRSPNVEEAVARQISAEVARAVAAIAETKLSGLGDDEYELELGDAGFGNFFKKIGKKLKKVVKKVAAVQKKIFIKPIQKAVKITEKVAKKTVEIHQKIEKKIHKAEKKVLKKVGKAIKPYIPIILTVVGAVLSPFTGGASLVVAGLLNAGYAVAMKAKQARAAKAANRQASAQMQAEVNVQSTELNKQLDDLFQQNQGVFAAAGISASQWSSMSLEQKLAVVERINSGHMPSSQDNANNAAEANGQTPPKQTQTWQQAIQASPILQQWGGEAGDTDPNTEGVQTPTGTYDVYVEGKKVGTAQTLAEASSIMAQNSKAGDRVEMFLNGRSLGLKLVTDGGSVISIPADQAEAVRSATREQIDALVVNATQAAKESGGSGGSAWLLLLAVPAALLFAKAKAG